MTYTPGVARHDAHAGNKLGWKILRMFLFAVIGLFIGSVIGLAIGPL